MNLYKIPAISDRDKPLYKGVLGTDVYSNLDISGGTYTDNTGKQVAFDGIVIDTVLFNVSQSKNILKTNIQGSDNGTVKEYIGMGDYNIDISLIITGDNGVHPFNKVAQLKRIFDAPMALKVNSYYLNNLGIFNIVIENYSFPQDMGGYSQQQVSIQAVSDSPVILQIQ